MRICKQCGSSIEHKPKINKFCNRSCSVSFNNTQRFISEETKNKIRKSVSKTTRDKYLRNPSSILELSSRTVTKMLQRMNVGCSNCGWNDATCDIHHINGRNITDADNHQNLSVLCPNCHRMVHEGKLTKLKSIDKTIPINWVEFYYG
jgi:hypothetical protein